MKLSLFLLIGSAALLTTQVACATNHEKSIYPDEIVHPIPEDLSVFKQPESLVADLAKIQKGSLRDRIRALADKSKRDQIFVEGGTFQMGDFGRLQSEEKLPWDGNVNSSPLHEVTLDSYSISKYKVTLAEFDLYAEANKVPTVQTSEIYTKILGGLPAWRTHDKPAGATWEQADAYCKWVGKITGQSFSLPTEAQWEYAARDRGRWIVYPTDNGKLEWNRNVPSRQLISAINGGRGGTPYRIAAFPPNPLGLYDLTKNSLDWVQDWYADDWYDHNDKAHNPTGPETGTEKVLRSWPAGDSRATMTMTRRHKNPGEETDQDGDLRSSRSFGFRCTINNPALVSSRNN
ncbi:formylglycine-generating enzyme family protein [Stenotrophomonas humi]